MKRHSDISNTMERLAINALLLDVPHDILSVFCVFLTKAQISWLMINPLGLGLVLSLVFWKKHQCLMHSYCNLNWVVSLAVEWTICLWKHLLSAVWISLIMGIYGWRCDDAVKMHSDVLYCAMLCHLMLTVFTMMAACGLPEMKKTLLQVSVFKESSKHTLFLPKISKQY